MDQTRARELQEKLALEAAASLKNRADEIAMELQRILAQKASAGICGRESKESLAYRWLELAASCAKVPIRYEADQIKQRQKEEQAQRGAGPVME